MDERKKKKEKTKKSISLQTTNPLTLYEQCQDYNCLVGCMCVKKKGVGGGVTILITAIFLINNAMSAFQSSWGGQWELCSKLYLSFYNDIQACSLGHNTPGTI